jgi:hypothetical protein
MGRLRRVEQVPDTLHLLSMAATTPDAPNMSLELTPSVRALEWWARAVYSVYMSPGRRMENEWRDARL